MDLIYIILCIYHTYQADIKHWALCLPEASECGGEQHQRGPFVLLIPAGTKPPAAASCLDVPERGVIHSHVQPAGKHVRNIFYKEGAMES